jgi:hypothetical protein
MRILPSLVPSVVIAFVLARAAVAGGSEPAPDAGPPLLVVVETGAGAGCDAETVRAAIKAELRARIVAPKAPSVVALAGPRTDTLLVAIDRERIVVTLRADGDHELTRSAAAPADPAERLRVVASLAAALERDQLATTTSPESPQDASPAPSAPSPAAPPLPAAGPATSASVARVEGAAPSPDFPRWALSLVVGAATGFPTPWQSPYGATAYPGGSGTSYSGGSVTWSPTAQLEVHRHLGPWFVGAAADVGPRPIHPLGAAVLVGRQMRAGRVGAEASAGLGEEAYVERTYYTAGVVPGFTGGDSGYTDETHASAYIRATFAVSYELWANVDLLAQLGGHLTLTSHENAGVGLGAVGLRLRLP